MYLLFQAVALDGVEDLDKVVLAGGFQDLKRKCYCNTSITFDNNQSLNRVLQIYH